jgi:anti-anti-sigma factor
MKTQIKKVGDTIVVTMNGKLDFDTYVPLRESLGRIVRNAKTDSTPKKIIINMENLEFVGSSGISSFIQTLKEFNINIPTKPRYCNVGNEFKRVIRAFDEAELFEFYENEERARRSFDN